MFENITYSVIMERLLSRVPSGVDKREGSVIYDALAPAATEITIFYQSLDYILTETFADSASRLNLIKRGAERGISPFDATAAVIEGIFTPGSIDILGRRFSVAGIVFTATEMVESGKYELRCDATGVVGNISSGALVPLDYVAGLSSATISQLLIPGAEEEDTEHFRQRYFGSLQAQAFGGNITDYQFKTNSLDGVGGTKVFPAWNGGGTVRLVIVDSQYGKPSVTLIENVQEAIDPIPDNGDGLGYAPIGHIVTVAGVEEVGIDVTTTIAYMPGQSYETAKEAIWSALDGYYGELRREWEQYDQIIVRISQIESRLLDVSAVMDIQSTAINGIASNFALSPEEIPRRGLFNGE